MAVGFWGPATELKHELLVRADSGHSGGGERASEFGTLIETSIGRTCPHYLSSQTSSRRAALKMLLTNTIWSLTARRMQIPPSV